MNNLINILKMNQKLQLLLFLYNNLIKFLK